MFESIKRFNKWNMQHVVETTETEEEMFDMKLIGRKIVELRKSKNMTQTELADKLSVSYQAVSNWERGSSMPDISKLPEIAEIFDITIDELLGKKAAFVESVVKDRIPEYIQNNEVTTEEVEEAIPILKPSQIEIIAANVENLPNVSAFLPFLNEEDVKEIALAAQERGEPINPFLPFMDESDVRELAIHAQERGEPINPFLPFMDESDVRELAIHAQERGEPMNPFLPFMDESDVRKLALEAQKRGETVSPFLPFMDESDVRELAIHALEKGESINSFLPFMDEDDVRELAMAVFGRKK